MSAAPTPAVKELDAWEWAVSATIVGLNGWLLVGTFGMWMA